MLMATWFISMRKPATNPDAARYAHTQRGAGFQNKAYG